jgi:S-adenosylmethionine:tRNA-ribosyltransferase-isomerase (queuine synthetase)
MIIDELDYELPERLVAQYPVPVRDHSKMMFYKRGSGQTRHAYFYQLPDYLAAGDLLVVNDSRVIKSRVFFKRPTGGKMEIFFLSRDHRGFSRGQTNRWECLFRPSRKVRPGDRIEGARAISMKNWRMPGKSRFPRIYGETGTEMAFRTKTGIRLCSETSPDRLPRRRPGFILPMSSLYN